LSPIESTVLNLGGITETEALWAGDSEKWPWPILTPSAGTAGDISRLKELAQKCPTAQIAAQLGRSYSATAVKAHELKLSLKLDRPKFNEPNFPGVDPGPAGFDWLE
jgi:hypothetical protein